MVLLNILKCHALISEKCHSINFLIRAGDKDKTFQFYEMK